VADGLHILTAQRVTAKAAVSKEERQLAKSVSFGLIYGLGVASLRRKTKADYGLDLSKPPNEPDRPETLVRDKSRRWIALHAGGRPLHRASILTRIRE
jgi:hypothetical protein